MCAELKLRDNEGPSTVIRQVNLLCFDAGIPYGHEKAAENAPMLQTWKKPLDPGFGPAQPKIVVANRGMSQ